MKRKLLAVIVSILLLCTMLPLSVFYVAAETSGTTGDCTWTLDDSGHLTISGEGKMADYYSYSSGTNTAPWGMEITDVTIEPGVTYIGEYAFQDSAELMSVTIPNTVTSIGKRAFNQCTRLNNIILPKNVSSLGEYVFCGCSNLTSIIIPDGITSIPEGTFLKCEALTAVTIPASVEYVYDRAFNGCTNLKDVYYCGSETTRQSTLNIHNLHSWNAPVINATWHYYDVRSTDSGLLYTILYDEVSILGYDETMPADVIISATIEGYPVTNIVSRAFFECTTLASIVIPDSVTNIGSYAFYKCTGLVSVTLPKGITNIKPHTFYGCSALTAIDIPHGITMLQNYAFGNCTSLASVTIPDSVITIRNAAFSNCEMLSEVTIPASVTSLGYAVFTTGAGLYESGGKLKAIHVDKNNPAYSSVDGVLFNKDQTTIIKCPGGRGGIYTVPSSVTTIGAGAFTGCHNLSAIHLPEGVTSIGGSAFSYCTGLTVFSIPEGVTSIEGSTFYCCDSIYSINIPRSVTSIGSSAFHQCYDLFDVYYGGTEEEQANITISETYNTYLTDAAWHCVDEPYQDPSFLIYEIVDGEAIITDATDTPARLTIPATLGGCPVTTIADEAFYWMSGMHNVIIPNTVTYIGERAFWSCQNLYSIKIPDSVTYIGEEAFYDCQGLSYVSLGDGIRSIEYNTFGNCINLWKVHIPDNVEVIKKHAFSNCRKLSSIYIPEGVHTIEQSAFSQCYAATAVSLPHSLITLGDFAFAHCEALTDVYYNGAEEEWHTTTYRENASHEYLFNATWHYNCINPKDHYSGRVDNSVMDTEDGDGLAYKFDLKLNGLKAIQGNRVDFANATVVYKGKTCKVVAMGAVVSNINNKKMELSDVNGSTVINVPVTYLTDLESENCAFAIRIINIPETALNRTIYARPYYVIETQDGTVTVYGDISSASCTEYL